MHAPFCRFHCYNSMTYQNGNEPLLYSHSIFSYIYNLNVNRCFFRSNHSTDSHANTSDNASIFKCNFRFLFCVEFFFFNFVTSASIHVEFSSGVHSNVTQFPALISHFQMTAFFLLVHVQFFGALCISTVMNFSDKQT